MLRTSCCSLLADGVGETCKQFHDICRQFFYLVCTRTFMLLTEEILVCMAIGNPCTYLFRSYVTVNRWCGTLGVGMIYDSSAGVLSPSFVPTSDCLYARIYSGRQQSNRKKPMVSWLFYFQRRLLTSGGQTLKVGFCSSNTWPPTDSRGFKGVVSFDLKSILHLKCYTIRMVLVW